MAGEGQERRDWLFDLFSQQPGFEAVTQGKYFVCPLCRRGFDRAATRGDAPMLTLAHIIPRKQGGKWDPLACKECNNDNGSGIEIDLLRSQQITDWAAGVGAIEVRLGEGGRIRASLTRGPGGEGMHLAIRTPMANPAVQAFRSRMEEMLNQPVPSGEFTYTMQLPRERGCWAAVCQSTYLLLFHYFGYDFAFDPTYEPLRQQVLKPDERHWDGNIWVLDESTAGGVLGDRQAAVAFTREPHHRVLAILKFASPGKIPLVLAVALPGPGEPPVEKLETVTFRPAVVPYDPETLKCGRGFFRWRWIRWVTDHE